MSSRGDETEELKAFLMALKQTEKEKGCTLVLGAIDSTEFQSIFRAKPANTSSDTRTLSYSIWKCIAMSNYLSSFFSVMISLPFMYGFVNVLWRHMTDYMIQKKKGKTEIHIQRIIGKVAADFNGPLGYLIGKKGGQELRRLRPVQ